MLAPRSILPFGPGPWSMLPNQGVQGGRRGGESGHDWPSSSPFHGIRARSRNRISADGPLLADIRTPLPPSLPPPRIFHHHHHHHVQNSSTIFNALRRMSTPPLPPLQGQAPENRPYGNYAAPTVESEPGAPPPVYMAARPPLGQAPSYSFAIEEPPPPPYILPKDIEGGTSKVATAHRMRWSRSAATVAIIVTAAAVIAGGLYGYHQGI